MAKKPPPPVLPTGDALKAQLAAIREELKRRAQNQLYNLFPDTGPFRRELYPKHLDFFRAGATCRERACLGANRSGKTTMGAYEVACHLTGWYPHWWQGKRFTKAVECWVAGETGKKTREVPQSKLCGRIGAPTAEDGEKPDGGAPTGMGSGLIPGHLIDRWVMKPGVPDAVDMMWIRHAAGGFSHLTFKSYEMQAIGFAGDEVDVIELDEEPDQTIYEECLLRTMTNDGIVMVTATPLLGWTPLILDLMGRTDEQVLKEAEEERERVALGEQVVDV